METNNPQVAMQQALLSRASYGGAVPIGWRILASQEFENGFRGFAYKNEVTGEIAVVYAGTNGWSDFSSDVNLALQRLPDQYQSAADFYESVRTKYGYVSAVSGHSLGGALAQLVGALQNVIAYSFNAPGVYGVLQGMQEAIDKYGMNLPSAESFTKINNYYMAMDAAKAVGTQLGNTTSYDPSIAEAASIIFSNLIPTAGSILSAYGVLQQHAIDRLIEAIAAPRPVDMIDGYRYDAQAKEWSRPGSDGAIEYASADKAASLTSIREQRVTYNTKVTEAAALAMDFFRMSNVVDTLSRDYGVPLDLYRQNDPNSGGYFLVNADGDIVAEVRRYDDGSALITTLDGRNIAVSDTASKAGFGTTLYNAVNQYGGPLIDALSLVRAIQSGNPLPVVTSGLRLANAIDRLDGRPDINGLAGAANVASGVLSVLSLEQALRRGDALAAITAGANAVAFGAEAYLRLAESNSAVKSAVEFLRGDGRGIFDGGTPGAVAVLSLMNDISHGDEVGAALDTLAIVNPEVGVPLQIAYTVFNMVSSLFDDDSPPEPWGNASAAWSDYNVVTNAMGEYGGLQTAQGTMNQFIATLNQLAAQQQASSPASPIGIVANRLPSLSYRNYTGYALTDIDAVTGVQRNPEVRYDLNGRPYNAPPGTEQGSQSLGERFVRVALARGAIAPLWEAQTAALQTQQGDPQAGLTEEERAGRNGQIAAPTTGIEQLWRPVVLDLDGNGIQTTGGAKTVAFDVDDSGFLKNTAWLNGGEGFLTLDRNLNGQTDSGRELFSNGMLDLGARGLAGMRWLDANYDGRIDVSDPVWNELRVWRDANGDGAEGAGEKLRLSELGIASLNYTMGTFEQNGQVRQLASPDLLADTEGTRTHVVPEGIVVESTNGQISLLVTRIEDRGAIEANRDGVTTYEDTETIISTADLVANDTLGAAPGQGLMVTSVCDFTHGTGYLDANGFVHYMPEANYYGAASFTYTVQDGVGQAATATVDLTIQNVNDAPTATVDQHLRAVYGYQGIEYDESGNPAYVLPAYEPYAGWDYATGTSGLHDTPFTYEDSDGPNSATIVVSDIDDPSGPFTFDVAQQAQKGQGVVYADGRVEYINWIGPNQPGTELDESSGPIVSDPFTVRVTDPHGANTTVTIGSQHAGVYIPDLGSGGGGGKPVSIDLDGNGFRFTDVNDSNIFFDINGDGWKNRMAWPSAGDGLLARDIDGDGKIDQANEISFTGYQRGAQTDLEALRAFDTNADGVLSAADEKWPQFGIWRDANQNGVTDEGEFKTLGDMGVASISLTSDGTFSVIDGQTVHGLGTVSMTDGSTRQLADVTLAYSNDVLVSGPDGTRQVARKAAFSQPGEVLEGTPENDLILGKTASNVIYAYEGDDVIFEDGGNDAIDGGSGNDTIYSGADNDIVIGGDGDDVVFAGRGNDLMLGGDGHDALFGEGGNDIGFGGNGNDLLYGGDGNDVLSGDRGDDQVYGGTGNDALFGGEGDDVLAGMEGYDLLYGGAGNDLLDGGADDDTMYGGAGDDVYVVDNVNDVVSEEQNAGVDTVRTGLSYVLGDNLENLTLTGSENISGTGNALDNVLAGNSGDNILDGGEGNDTLNGGAGADVMTGGAGNDIYVVDNAGDVVREYAGEGEDTVRTSRSYTLGDNVENLILTGFSAIDGTGNALNNRLTGNSADNILDGRTGADVMAGGLGNDTYVIDNANDRVIEAVEAGYDTVRSALSHTLEANVEAFVLTGEAEIDGTGNELNNVLTGNISNNTLNGGVGADRMAGGAGDDTYVVDNVADVVIERLDEGTDTVIASVSYGLADNAEVLRLAGTDNIDGIGNSLNNVIEGNVGNNVIDGAVGADTMLGGAGNDTYFVDNAADQVVEAAGDGTDTVVSSINYSLADNIEALVLTGPATQGSGNELGNTMTANDLGNRLYGGGGDDDLRGGACNDVLDGGAGADVMSGGRGDDTYVVDDAGDVVTERSGEGYDTVNAAVSYALNDNVERLILTGAADTSGSGNALDNVIIGNSGSNVLDGGAGADTMIGGAGDDAYVVDAAADAITEYFSGGWDSVYSSVSYVLPEQVEALTLTANADIDATGNDLDNVLTGNGGDNILDGRTGADVMAGGLGNDTYVIDNAGDRMIEAIDAGYDTIRSALSHTLEANVEALVLTGEASIDGVGNELDNVLTGNISNNTLNGGAGADTMIGGAGDDTYFVDNAADRIIEASDAGYDRVFSSVDYSLEENLEALTLVQGATRGTGNALDNTIVGNDSDNALYGLEGQDVLNGGGGNDFLDGGAGADVMAGGAGNDTYFVDDAADRIIENAGEGQDTVIATVNHALAANAEALILAEAATEGSGNELANTLTGNDLGNRLFGGGGNDELRGGAGSDLLDGGTGADRMTGGAGDDDYVVDNVADTIIELPGEGRDSVYSLVSYVLPEQVEALTLTGAAGINGTGNRLDNTLTGNSGNNMLDGGIGMDAMAGGLGNDTYVIDDAGDRVIEAIDAGYDTIRSALSHTLEANVEALVLTGEAEIDGTGNELNNVLTGNISNNTLNGGVGADRMVGGAGDDSYVVDDAGDTIIERTGEGGYDRVDASISYVLPEAVEALTLTGTADTNATGNALDNVITGNSGNNVLDGAEGADVMIGGAGDDTYFVDNAADQVIENAGEGIDRVLASVSYTLSNNVETLTLTGTGNIDATGNSLNNVLNGNDGNNRLDGGTGADVMSGGCGDDTYVVDDAGDVVTERSGEGYDTVNAAISYALTDDVEALTLTGAATEGAGNELANTLTANDLGNRLYGRGGDDELRGGAGNDVLDGGIGNDAMTGGKGDDLYIVDAENDRIIEREGEGRDRVVAGVNHVLVLNVEDLTLTGAAVRGVGNDLDNIIVGNASDNVLLGELGNDVLVGGDGNDLLDGGSGADRMSGGAGDDTYVVDDAGDVVTERSGEGYDTVNAAISYALTDNVEALTLTGAADINGTGNRLDNTLTGNSGNNVLDGAAGVDTMTGGAGNDVYVVDNSSDRVTELSGEGHDVVFAGASYVLSENVEDLSLTGTADIDGTGNALDNVIVGNGGDNRLEGRDGNDTLTGGLGNDALDGGSGDDVYVYNIGDGLDTITDVSGTDSVRFGAGLSLADVALRVRIDNGVSIAQVRVLDADGCEQSDQGFDFALNSDLHGAAASPIERFVFADGSVRTWDELLIRRTTTYGNSRTLSITTGRDDDTIYGGPRGETIATGTGNDIVYGGSGADTVYGEGGDDYLAGGTASDTLDGGCGVNVLDGRQGDDVLVVTGEGSALIGGNGFDSLRSAAGADFVAAGKQDDTIDAGAGSNVVAFNATDGRDVVLPAAGARNTLSLGGNVSTDQLYLRRLGADLRLEVKDDNNITFRNWYSDTANQNFVTLQVFNDARTAQQKMTQSPRIDRYDFKTLVARFDEARAADAALDRWGVMNGLLESHLATSDSAALGGDLAATYAGRGDLSGMNLSTVQEELRSPQFGTEAQVLRPWQQISGETVRLS